MREQAPAGLSPGIRRVVSRIRAGILVEPPSKFHRYIRHNRVLPPTRARARCSAAMRRRPFW